MQHLENEVVKHETAADGQQPDTGMSERANSDLTPYPYDGGMAYPVDTPKSWFNNMGALRMMDITERLIDSDRFDSAEVHQICCAWGNTCCNPPLGNVDILLYVTSYWNIRQLIKSQRNTPEGE